MKKYNKIIGETIKNAWFEGIKPDGDEPYDDEPYLILEMESGKVFRVEGFYGGYTGNSEDEYPRFVSVEEIK